MSHPWVIAQFELNFAAPDYALNCMQCKRPSVPNSKHMERLPPRAHSPGACGQSIFEQVRKYELNWGPMTKSMSACHWCACVGGKYGQERRGLRQNK